MPAIFCIGFAPGREREGRGDLVDGGRRRRIDTSSLIRALSTLLGDWDGRGRGEENVFRGKLTHHMGAS